MIEKTKISIIARIENDLREKFGVPRQSNLAGHILSRIVFEPEFRDVNALRGLEEYSHLWLIWEFSEVVEGRKNLEEDGRDASEKANTSAKNNTSWKAMVRPPRLGGNKRVGVFATRSPFRPNPIGLSCVKLEHIELDTPEGPVLYVSGADLMDRTPIYDIKPYLPYVDCHPEATGSFSEEKKKYRLRVELPETLRDQFLEMFFNDRNDSQIYCGEMTKVQEAETKLNGLLEILALDPRPSYQDDPKRIYGMKYGDFNVLFHVTDGVLTIDGIE